jgi:ABC-type sugar transport system ATPase subunit
MTNTNKNELVLKVVSASKAYEGELALENVNFDLFRGEVHALIGENGAGKSTLCKGICGTTEFTSGHVILSGKNHRFSTPAQGLAAGISMVYQETSLIPTMTVAQNLLLGHEPVIYSLGNLEIDAHQLLRSFSFAVDSTEYVANLGAAQRQMVEIARAVFQNARIIIFDEPTATLTPEEKASFFALVRSLQRKGISIIFISHMLEEAFEIADRITVLRDGQHVITASSNDLTRDKLVQFMVGRDLSQTDYKNNLDGQQARNKNREKVLRIENVSKGNAINNMSFSIYTGEVTCLAGLVGSGRTDIAKIIYGAEKRDWWNGGKIYLKGKPIRYRVPKQAIDDGIVYITEDRKKDGIFSTKNIGENIYLGKQVLKSFNRFFRSKSDWNRTAKKWISLLNIRTLSTKVKGSELSGGNQQKMMIAKSLIQKPQIVIFDEPTRGVDVGSIDEIHQYIRSLANDGIAVLMISSYMPEVFKIADRILVTRLGRIVEEFSIEEATQEKIMYAAIH